MADIRPFRALRYDTGKVRLEDVVTQPYDKITAAMQRAYYQRHPANFIRFELPMPDAGDVYAGARRFLEQMKQEGMIRLEERPALYLYEQEFTHPTSPERLLRRALITLGRLHDYGDGVVYRHEQTLTGPKKDREQLLKTTRVQSGLLFLMYDDASRTVEQLPRPAETLEFVDDLGVKQHLWAITDAETIRKLQDALHPQPLFIADGHHRYETALAQRRSREGKYAEDFAMMALVNMRSEGLVVLPTHRAIFDVAPERLRACLEKLKAQRRMKTLPSRGAASIAKTLQGSDEKRFVCVIATKDTAYLLQTERARRSAGVPPGIATASSPAQKGWGSELDVETLHSLFAELLGITAADVTAQKHVRYHRHIEEALNDVDGEAQAAFLIRPVAVETIRDRSLRGALMPQKSTDFYPKMNSGLTLYSWDESF